MRFLRLLSNLVKKDSYKSKRHFKEVSRSAFAVITILILILSVFVANSRDFGNILADACPVGYPKYTLTENNCVRFVTTQQKETGLFPTGRSIAINDLRDVFIIGNSGGENYLLFYPHTDYSSPQVYNFPVDTYSPSAITVDGNGNVYTANYGSNSITIFPSGNYSSPSNYSLPVGSSSPTDIAVDSANNIYTANESTNDITQFLSIDLSNPTSYSLVDGYGPRGIFISSSDYIYTADSLSNSVTIVSIGDLVNPVTYGTPDLSSPSSVVTDEYGNIYVGDQDSAIIEELDPSGNVITTLSNGTSSSSKSIAYNAGYLYVATDEINGVFSRVNTSTSEVILGTTLLQDGNTITDLEVDSSGNVYTSTIDNSGYLYAPFFYFPIDSLMPNLSCPTVTPAYEVNSSQCERYLDPIEVNAGGTLNAFSLYVDANGTIYTINNEHSNPSISIIHQPALDTSVYYQPNVNSDTKSIFANANGVFTANGTPSNITFFPSSDYNSPVEYALPVGSFYPISITGDSAGNIYTANYDSPDISMFPVGDYGNPISYQTYSGYPTSIFVAGNVIYTANDNNSFSVFDPSDMNNVFSVSAPADVYFSGNSPSTITVDQQGNVYIVSSSSGGFYGYTKFTRTDATYPYTYDGGEFVAVPYGYYPSQIDVDSSENIIMAADGTVIRIIQGPTPVTQLFSYYSPSYYDDVIFGNDKSFYVTGYSDEVNNQVTKFTFDSFSLLSTPTVDLWSDINPSNFGEFVNFEGYVIGSSGTPTGTVDLYSDSTLLDSQLLDGSGYYNFSISNLTSGTHYIHAHYQGDLNYGPADSNTYNQEVIYSENATITSLTTTQNPWGANQWMSFNITVESASGTPTGDVFLFEGGNQIGQSPLDWLGQTSIGVMFGSPAGLHQITAQYQGDGVYTPSSSNVYNIDIQEGTWFDYAPETGYPSSNFYTHSFIEAREDLILGVTMNGDFGIPTGTVSFDANDGDIDLGTATLDSSGHATVMVNNLVSGGYNIRIRYSGDSVYGPNAFGPIPEVIYANTTHTSISSSLNPSYFTDSVTFTAHSDAVGGGFPTGQIKFTDSSKQIGDLVNLDSNGNASITINNFTPGTHRIRAVYIGETFFRTSSSPTLFQAVDGPVDPNPPTYEEPINPPSHEGNPISDFNIRLEGEDARTLLQQAKINDLLNWTITYDNLGIDPGSAEVYIPIKENQVFIVGSVQAPVGFTVSYSQDFICDDSTFTYVPSGETGSKDATVKCLKFTNGNVNSPPNNSRFKYITTTNNIDEINVRDFGADDVFKIYGYKNKLYYFDYFNYWVNASDPAANNPNKNFFCFDIAKNDVCDSVNSEIVYPITMGVDGFDIPFSLKMEPFTTAVIVDEKMYFPVSDSSRFESEPWGNGILCWDLELDTYCTGGGFEVGGIHIFDHDSAFAWGWGNMFDIAYVPETQEIYSLSVHSGYIHYFCFNLATGTDCAGTPMITDVPSYDPQIGYLLALGTKVYSISKELSQNAIIPSSKIHCIDALTKTRCPNFPTYRRVDPNINIYIPFQANGQFCMVAAGLVDPLVEDKSGIYCYNEVTDTFDLKVDKEIGAPLNPHHLANTGYPDEGYKNRIYIPTGTSPRMDCFDTTTWAHCPGWEEGKMLAGNNAWLSSVSYDYGCLWSGGGDGKVMHYDPETGGACEPTFTQQDGASSVRLDATGMFCNSSVEGTNVWNNIKVYDQSTFPSPNTMTVQVYDSENCTFDAFDRATCTGDPLRTGNLLLNSGHTFDISDISYSEHTSLTAKLFFSYPTIPDPAPAFSIRMNASLKPNICCQTQLVFSGALCANPITSVCGSTNINNINDPISSNNTYQSCMPVETYYGKDPNSSFCFVDVTNKSVFKVTNPDAVVAPAGEQAPVVTAENYGKGGDGTTNIEFGGFFGGFLDSIGVSVSEETVRQIITSVNIQTPLQVTAIAAVAVTAVVGTSIISSTQNIGQILGLIAGFFTSRRKKYWGYILDEITNKPIAFASITLTKKELQKDNEIHTIVIAQTVSDLDGRYRLNTAQRDNFTLEVKASGYKPYSKFIQLSKKLVITEDIIYDVSLKRLDANINPLSNILNYHKSNLIDLLRNLALLMSVFGFMTAIYTLNISTDPINLVMLGLYIVMFMVNIYPRMYRYLLKKGYILDKDVRSRIAGAVVRIYDARQQIALSLSNSKGEVRFDLQPGDYYILSNKKGFEMLTASGQGKHKLLKAKVEKEGYLDRNILMKRVSDEAGATDEVLENPFG